MGTRGKARPGRDANHSSPSGAKVENEWSYTPLSLSACMACRETAFFHFIFDSVLKCSYFAAIYFVLYLLHTLKRLGHRFINHGAHPTGDAVGF
jgi:hypothetical protein